MLRKIAPLVATSGFYAVFYQISADAQERREYHLVIDMASRK